MIEYLKDKRFLAAGGTLLVGMMLFGWMRKPSGNTEIVMTAEGMSEGNLELIDRAQNFALSTEQMRMDKEVALASLENDRYVTDAGVAMLKDNNAAYLDGLEANNQFALASQVSQQEYALVQAKEASALSQYLSASAERIRGAELATENAIAGAEFADRASERAASYNLANYQTMVDHDVRKKQTKASYYGGIINSVAGLTTSWMGTKQPAKE